MKLNELINIPESIYIEPGYAADCGIRKIIDSFFNQVYNTLIDKLKIPKQFQMGPCSHFERRVKTLVEPSGAGRLSDDQAHMFLYLERVVAIVTETRSSSNFIHFNFFANLEGADIAEYSQDGGGYEFKRK